MRWPLTLLLSMCMLVPAFAADLEKASVPAGARGDAVDTYVMKPAAAGPRPTVIALHGCGGLFNRKGALSARHRDWGERWVGAGFVTLFPDSFGSRQLGSQCKVSKRAIPPRLRAEDVTAVVTWAAGQPFIDKSRLALVGWSNGGSTVLWALRPGQPKPAADFKVAIAFYPGCRVPLQRIAGWQPRVPLSILIGAADNWTPPEPCRELGKRIGVRLVEYPEAVHGFDAPNSPLRERKGVAYSKDGSGVVRVGTDQTARAAAIAEVTGLLAKAFH